MDDYAEEARHLEKVRKSHKKRLEELEIKEATFGLNVAPEVLIEIKEIKQKISQINRKLSAISQKHSKRRIKNNTSQEKRDTDSITIGPRQAFDQDYRASLLSKSKIDIEVAANSIFSVEVLWKNLGRITWTNIVRMGPNKPKERFSRFYSRSLNWFAPNRILFIEDIVIPNATATFRIPCLSKCRLAEIRARLCHSERSEESGPWNGKDASLRSA